MSGTKREVHISSEGLLRWLSALTNVPIGTVLQCSDGVPYLRVFARLAPGSVNLVEAVERASTIPGIDENFRLLGRLCRSEGVEWSDDIIPDLASGDNATTVHFLLKLYRYYCQNHAQALASTLHSQGGKKPQHVHKVQVRKSLEKDKKSRTTVKNETRESIDHSNQSQHAKSAGSDVAKSGAPPTAPTAVVKPAIQAVTPDFEVTTPRQIVSAAHYKPIQARLISSVAWLASLVASRLSADVYTDHLVKQVAESLFDLLKAIAANTGAYDVLGDPKFHQPLTSGSLYVFASNTILSQPSSPERCLKDLRPANVMTIVKECFEKLAFEEDDFVEPRKLAAPFEDVTWIAHQSLLDQFMEANVKKMIDVEAIVAIVKRLSDDFDPTSEYPFDLEDAFLLWINTVCACCNRTRFSVALMDDLLRDIGDGQCLATVVSYYVPEVAPLEDVRTGRILSVADKVENLGLVRKVCRKLGVAFCFREEDLIYCTSSFKTNVLTFMSELIAQLERAVDGNVQSPLRGHHSTPQQTSQIPLSVNTASPTQSTDRPFAFTSPEPTNHVDRGASPPSPPSPPTPASVTSPIPMRNIPLSPDRYSPNPEQQFSQPISTNAKLQHPVRSDSPTITSEKKVRPSSAKEAVKSQSVSSAHSSTSRTAASETKTSKSRVSRSDKAATSVSKSSSSRVTVPPSISTSTTPRPKTPKKMSPSSPLTPTATASSSTTKSGVRKTVVSSSLSSSKRVVRPKSSPRSRSTNSKPSAAPPSSVSEKQPEDPNPSPKELEGPGGGVKAVEAGDAAGEDDSLTNDLRTAEDQTGQEVDLPPLHVDESSPVNRPSSARPLSSKGFKSTDSTRVSSTSASAKSRNRLYVSKSSSSRATVPPSISTSTTPRPKTPKKMSPSSPSTPTATVSSSTTTKSGVRNTVVSSSLSSSKRVVRPKSSPRSRSTNSKPLSDNRVLNDMDARTESAAGVDNEAQDAATDEDKLRSSSSVSSVCWGSNGVVGAATSGASAVTARESTESHASAVGFKETRNSKDSIEPDMEPQTRASVEKYDGAGDGRRVGDVGREIDDDGQAALDGDGDIGGEAGVNPGGDEDGAAQGDHSDVRVDEGNIIPTMRRQRSTSLFIEPGEFSPASSIAEHRSIFESCDGAEASTVVESPASFATGWTEENGGAGGEDPPCVDSDDSQESVEATSVQSEFHMKSGEVELNQSLHAQSLGYEQHKSRVHRHEVLRRSSEQAHAPIDHHINEDVVVEPSRKRWQSTQQLKLKFDVRSSGVVVAGDPDADKSFITVNRQDGSPATEIVDLTKVPTPSGMTETMLSSDSLKNAPNTPLYLQNKTGSDDPNPSSGSDGSIFAPADMPEQPRQPHPLDVIVGNSDSYLKASVDEEVASIWGVKSPGDNRASYSSDATANSAGSPGPSVRNGHPNDVPSPSHSPISQNCTVDQYSDQHRTVDQYSDQHRTVDQYPDQHRTVDQYPDQPLDAEALKPAAFPHNDRSVPESPTHMQRPGSASSPRCTPSPSHSLGNHGLVPVAVSDDPSHLVDSIDTPLATLLVQPSTEVSVEDDRDRGHPKQQSTTNASQSMNDGDKLLLRQELWRQQQQIEKRRKAELQRQNDIQQQIRKEALMKLLAPSATLTNNPQQPIQGPSITASGNHRDDSAVQQLQQQEHYQVEQRPVSQQQPRQLHHLDENEGNISEQGVQTQQDQQSSVNVDNMGASAHHHIVAPQKRHVFDDGRKQSSPVAWGVETLPPPTISSQEEPSVGPATNREPELERNDSQESSEALTISTPRDGQSPVQWAMAEASPSTGSEDGRLTPSKKGEVVIVGGDSVDLDEYERRKQRMIERMKRKEQERREDTDQRDKVRQSRHFTPRERKSTVTDTSASDAWNPDNRDVDSRAGKRNTTTPRTSAQDGRAKKATPNTSKEKAKKDTKPTHFDLSAFKSGRSNKKMIKNALSFVCLAGHAKQKTREEALLAIDSSDLEYFAILFRTDKGMMFRALYGIDGPQSTIRLVHGRGPAELQPAMIQTFYKYDSGAKDFKPLLIENFSVTTDAVGIHPSFFKVASTPGTHKSAMR